MVSYVRDTLTIRVYDLDRQGATLARLVLFPSPELAAKHRPDHAALVALYDHRKFVQQGYAWRVAERLRGARASGCTVAHLGTHWTLREVGS